MTTSPQVLNPLQLIATVITKTIYTYLLPSLPAIVLGFTRKICPCGHKLNKFRREWNGVNAVQNRIEHNRTEWNGMEWNRNETKFKDTI